MSQYFLCSNFVVTERVTGYMKNLRIIVKFDFILAHGMVLEELKQYLLKRINTQYE